MITRLKSHLEVQFGVTLSMSDLFHASTLSGMTTLISNTLSGEKPEFAPTVASF